MLREDIPLRGSAPLFAPRWLRVEGSLARYCRALIAVEVQPDPGVELTVVPHDAFVVSLQLCEGPEPFGRSTERGSLPHACGWRRVRHSYLPPGGCRSFFALLTPEGAVTLAGGRTMFEGDVPRRPLNEWFERPALVAIEDAVAREHDVEEQLRLFARWIEQLLLARQGVPVPWQARRAARLLSALFEHPAARFEELAAGEVVGRRQLERDFARWLGIAPKQASQVARVQAAARLGWSGQPLAEIAHRLGFVDQSHMTRTVQRVAGVTPSRLVRTAGSSLAAAFREATGGGVVYL